MNRQRFTQRSCAVNPPIGQSFHGGEVVPGADRRQQSIPSTPRRSRLFPLSYSQPDSAWRAVAVLTATPMHSAMAVGFTSVVALRQHEWRDAASGRAQQHRPSRTLLAPQRHPWPGSFLWKQCLLPMHPQVAAGRLCTGTVMAASQMSVRAAMCLGRDMISHTRRYTFFVDVPPKYNRHPSSKSTAVRRPNDRTFNFR